MRQSKPFHFDAIFFVGVMCLVGLGVVIIYSSSGAYAEQKNLPNTFFLVSHLKKVFVGLFALTLGFVLNFKIWEKFSRPFLFVTLLSLIYLVTASGITGIHGAKRWIQLGGFSLQPSELAKIAAIFFLAKFLTDKENLIGEFKKGLLASLVMVGILFALVLKQPDYSSAAIILSIAAVLIFAGGAQIKHLFLLALTGIPALGFLMVSSSYRLQRVMAFLNPDENTASSYQAIHSLIGLGTGGLTGTGLGTGTQKLGYLPMPFTDTIFSIMGEELGLIGTFICLLLFALIIWRGLRVAFLCADRFGSLVALGIITSFAVTVVMHVGVCAGFFPTTGQPLPFVSYGGTALISMMFLSGILLNISTYPIVEASHVNRMDLQRTYRSALAKQRLGV